MDAAYAKLIAARKAASKVNRSTSVVPSRTSQPAKTQYTSAQIQAMAKARSQMEYEAGKRDYQAYADIGTR